MKLNERLRLNNLRSRLAAAEADRDAARAEVARLREDADKLRVLLATSNANCAFCGLPAAEMAKCASDFPGCSRADDMILCVHPTRQDLLDEVERLREDAARARWCEEKKASVFWSILAREWRVAVYDEAYNSLYTSKADRNAAIDAARGVK